MNAQDRKRLLTELAAKRNRLMRAVPGYISSAEDRKDIVQEALRKVAEEDLTRIRTPESLYCFTRTTVYNLARDRVRDPLYRAKYVSAPEALLHQVLSRTKDNRTPEEITSTLELKRLLREALNSLKPTIREVIYLRLWEGYTPAEIAARLELSPKSVSSLASVGLKELVEVFNKLSGNAEPRRDKP